MTLFINLKLPDFSDESLTGPQRTGQMLFEKEKIDILKIIVKPREQHDPTHKIY